MRRAIPRNRMPAWVVSANVAPPLPVVLGSDASAVHVSVTTTPAPAAAVSEISARRGHSKHVERKVPHASSAIPPRQTTVHPQVFAAVEVKNPVCRVSIALAVSAYATLSLVKVVALEPHV